MVEIIKDAANEAQAVIRDAAQGGFSIQVQDIASGEFLPCIRRMATIEKAREFAKEVLDIGFFFICC